MNEITPFTLSYLKLHTQNAANVLERLPAEDTVAFLEAIPRELAAKTLEVMAPQYAAQCFLIMSPETCSQCMQEMKTTTGISLFRFMPNSVTQTILKQLLPEKKALITKRLAYAQVLVGAWMDSEDTAVSPTTLVGEIRKSIRMSKKEIAFAPCVVDTDGTVLGVLSLAGLITAKDSNAVSTIMEKDFKEISDRGTVQSISSLAHWERFDALPVINSTRKFVGILTLKNLNKALVILKGDSTLKGVDSVLMDGVNAYVATLSWLVQSTTASPSGSKEDGNGN